MYILKDYPSKEQLLASQNDSFRIHEVNGHIHTPYSFSAFNDIDQIFEMAKKENVKVVGINDFYVTDGQKSFYDAALKNKVFPMFNMECITLMKEEQSLNIRINDPNNPGRCYFSAKGLNFPFALTERSKKKLDGVIAESQVQVKAMVAKANEWFASCKVDIKLDFETIKKQFAKELVRERHIAKALRVAIWEKSKTDDERKELLKMVYGGKDSKSPINDFPALENEIRGMLFKAGGFAFVPETDAAFMSLEDCIQIYVEAGAIPCYPLLLDDAKGNYTEFEADKESLYKELTKRGIGCIELIPGRNDLKHLTELVNYFNNKGFIILLGTEHNAPDMIPLTCDTRGKIPLTDDLRKIAYEGACVVAAHQYLQANGEQGFLSSCGHARSENKAEFIKLGHAVIEKWIN